MKVSPNEKKNSHQGKKRFPPESMYKKNLASLKILAPSPPPPSLF